MLKIAICDDNIVHVKKLENLLESYFSKERYPIKIYTYTNSSLFLSDCNSKKFDITFLDVEMTPINGIQTGEYLRKVFPNIILVYISGYIDYSVQGYKVQAFRYILKKDLDVLFLEEMNAIMKEYKKSNECFTYKKDGEIIKIPYQDILYLMSDERKVMIFTISEEIHSLYAKLDDLNEQFAYNNFLRVQQSYIVNLKYSTKLSNYNIYLHNNIVIPTTKKNFHQLKLQYAEMKGRM